MVSWFESKSRSSPVIGSGDRDGSHHHTILFRHSIPAERRIQEHKATLIGGFMLC